VEAEVIYKGPSEAMKARGMPGEHVGRTRAQEGARKNDAMI